MTTLVKTWTYAKKRLEAAGIDSPTIDARILLIAATGATRNEIVTDPHRAIGEAARAKLDGFLARRETREPVAHIVGKKAFWSLELLCDARALVPRPETEVIVDLMLKRFGDDTALSVLDIGTGSGAILLALLAERKSWRGIGTDKSEAALSLAVENANLHGLETRVEFIQTNWADAINQKFDIVVSNPPYIPSADIAGLSVDVRNYDPIHALDGGETGLDPYHHLFENLDKYLKPNGVFAFEFGIGQGADICEIARKNGFGANLKIIDDLSGIQRVIMGESKQANTVKGF